MSSRLLKNPKNRLLARAAQKRHLVFAITYRAATARERCPGSLFQHPARSPAITVAILAAAFSLPGADLGLLEAVKRRDYTAIAALARDGKQLNAAQPDGATALAWAAHLDDTRAADLLLEAGAEVNIADDYGDTPLTLACGNGNGAFVEKLLKAGADARAARWNGETALMIAAGAGSAQAVRLLAARGADLNAVEGRKGQNALMWAAAEGHSETVQELIRLGASVNAKSASGFNALVFAAIKNDAGSIRALIDAGGDPNYALPSGNKVLAVAASYKSLAAANALVLAGADPNVADRAGNTPLHVAAQLGDGELVASLLKKRADPNAQTPAAPSDSGNGGRRRATGRLTPLHLAAAAKHEHLLPILAAGGARPLLDAEGNTTLLMFAAQSGSAGLVRYVYENLDSRIDAVSATGASLMHHAVMGTVRGATEEEICEVVRFLAAKGAKPGEKDRQGRTPVQLAARSSLDAVAALLNELILKAAPKAAAKYEKLEVRLNSFSRTKFIATDKGR